MLRSISENIKLFTHVRHTWGTLPHTEKFTLYYRISLQTLALFLPLPLVREKNSLWEFIPLLPALIFAITFLGRVPELNPHSYKDYRKIFRTGFLLATALWITSTSASFIYPGHYSIWTVQFISSYLLCLVYLPFVHYTWWGISIITIFSTWACLHSSNTLSFFSTGLFIGFLLAYPSLFAITTQISVWSIKILKQAERSAELQHTLTLTKERLRFSQEMHDTLGQNLAALSLKTELVNALAKREDPRLYDELKELQNLTHKTTTEMREVIQGYRTISLESEISGAAALLQSAGIDFHVTGHIKTIPQDQRELSAWFIREATTNILKHSTATMATLSVNPQHITFSNDGVLKKNEPLTLSGISTLKRRALTQYNAQISLEKQEKDFSIILLFPPTPK